MYNRMLNGRRLCMDMNQAEREIKHKRIKQVYIWETVQIPRDFIQRCKHRGIEIIITR